MKSEVHCLGHDLEHIIAVREYTNNMMHEAAMCKGKSDLWLNRLVLMSLINCTGLTLAPTFVLCKLILLFLNITQHNVATFHPQRGSKRCLLYIYQIFLCVSLLVIMFVMSLMKRGISLMLYTGHDSRVLYD